MTATDYDVAVIGLGPVGLVACHLLAQSGHRVLALEQYSERLKFPRAIALDSETLRIFQSIGLAEQLTARMRPSDGLELIDSQGKSLLHVRIASENGYHESWMFDQPQMEELLELSLQKLPQVSIKKGWQLVQLEQNATSVSLQYKHSQNQEEQTATARYLIGCDGANSTVRQLLNISQSNWKYSGHQLKIDAELLPSYPSPNLPERVQKHCSKSFPWVRMRGYGQHIRWEFPLPSYPSHQDLHQLSLSLLDKVGAKPEKLRIRHTSLYRYESKYAKKWREGQVFIAGDAAHLTPPYIGQGLCAGLRDVANLSWKISEALNQKEGNQEPLLNSYQSERLPHFRFALAIAIGIGFLFKSPIYRLLRLLHKVPFLEKILLNLRVASPPIGKGYWGKGKGARGLFPQASLHLPDGTSMLSDDFLGKDWVLVTLDSSLCKQDFHHQHRSLKPLLITPDLDKSQVLHRWFQKCQATCAIIRPDKFVYASW